MKNKGAKIVVLVASAIVGLLIALNFNFEGQRTSELNALEYQDAIEERNKLYAEMTNLHEVNKEATEKISEYTNSGKEEEDILKSMMEQVADYGMLTGLNEVKGPGVSIKIVDGKVDYSDGSLSDYEKTSKILHDQDMERLINELRVAGAEAIALNDYRLRPSSGVICNWAFLVSEDDVQLGAPFYLYGIGNPEILKTTLLADGSFLRQLMIRGLNIEIEEKSEIIMPAATPFEFKYAEEYLKKDE